MSLRKCKECKNHYSDHLKRCPWCDPVGTQIKLQDSLFDRLILFSKTISVFFLTNLIPRIKYSKNIKIAFIILSIFLSTYMIIWAIPKMSTWITKSGIFSHNPNPDGIIINSTPGAHVYLDGKFIGKIKKNGYLLHKITRGPHKLTLTKDGYKPLYKSFDDSVSHRMHLPLKKKPVNKRKNSSKTLDGSISQEKSLALKKEPSENRRDPFTLHNIAKSPKPTKSIAPYTAAEIRMGNQTNRADRYKADHFKKFESSPKSPKLTKSVAPKSTYLTVKSNLAEAEVFLNGISIGRTNDKGIIKRQISPSSYTVKVTKAGYKPYERTWNVKRGHSIAIQDVYLKKIYVPVVRQVYPQRRTTSQYRRRRSTSVPVRPPPEPPLPDRE